MRTAFLSLVILAGCGRTELATADRLGGENATVPDDDASAGTTFAGFGLPVPVVTGDALVYSGSRYFTAAAVYVTSSRVDSQLSIYDAATGATTIADTVSLGDTYQCTIAQLPVVFAGALYYLVSAYDTMSGPFWVVRRSGDDGATWSTAAGSAPLHAFPSAMLATDTALYVAFTSTELSTYGGSIARSTNGTTFTNVAAPAEDGQSSSVYHYGTTLIADGFSFDGTNVISAWVERSSTDDGLTWSDTGRWFSSGLGQWNRAAFSFEVPNVSGRFIAGTVHTTTNEWASRVVRLDGGASAPVVVDDVAVAESEVLPVSALAHPSGYTLVITTATRNTTRDSFAGIRGTRDGVTWIDLFHNDGVVSAIYSAVVLDNGDLLASVTQMVGDSVSSGLARVPVVYEQR